MVQYFSKFGHVLSGRWHVGKKKIKNWYTQFLIEFENSKSVGEVIKQGFNRSGVEEFDDDDDLEMRGGPKRVVMTKFHPIGENKHVACRPFRVSLFSYLSMISLVIRRLHLIVTYSSKD